MTSRRGISIILAAAVLMTGAFLLFQTARAQTGDASDCEVKVTWTPNPGPWHQSGGTTFTLQESTCEKYDGTACTAADYNPVDFAPGSNTCTTSGVPGSECTVWGVVAKTDFAQKPPTNSTPIICTFPSAQWQSPANEIDNTPPVCGTTWSAFNAQNQTTLSGSSDSQSGLSAGNNYTCTASSGNTCTVTIADNSSPANSATCTSPTNPNSPSVNPPITPPAYSASISWTPTAVGPGDSATESWSVQGADTQAGDCVVNGTDLAPGGQPISASGQYTFTNVKAQSGTTPPSGYITCTVWGVVHGVKQTPASATLNIDSITCTDPNYIFVNSNIPATWCVGLGGWAVSRSNTFRQVADLSNGWLGDLASRSVSSNLLARAHTVTPGPCYIQQKTAVYSAGYQPNPYGVYSITPDTMPGYGQPQVVTTPPNGSITQCAQQVNFNLTYTQTGNPPGNPPGPTASGTIVVTSNMSTTWVITGPQSETQSAASAGPATYRGVAVGAYTIVPSDSGGLSGYTVSVSPATSQTVTNGGTVQFRITYTPTTGSCSPTLTLNPASSTVPVGGTTSYIAVYDPDGPAHPDGSCSLPPGNVSVAATWTIDNSALASNLGSGGFQGTAVGATFVHAAYAGLTATSSLTVTPLGGPYYGCVSNQCAIVSGASSNTDGCNAGNAGTTCNVSSGTHAECVANACVQVANSPGDTANRCGNNADCANGGGGGGTPPIHGECDPVQQACVNKTGTLPAGKTACGADPACGGGGPTHLACQGNACVIVGGAGVNEGGCTAVGQDCTITQNPSGGCQFFKANPGFITRGNNSVLSWQCDNSVQNCTIQGAPVPSTGTKSVSPSVSTQYILSCNSGSITLPVSVYVVQSYKETNPGGQ